MECLICKSNSGEKRISPGPTIYDGKYWLVEHAYPTKIKGWLVIVLKRHSEALHNLSVEEFQELSIIESKIVTFPPKTSPDRMLVWKDEWEERWRKSGSRLNRS